MRDHFQAEAEKFNTTYPDKTGHATVSPMKTGQGDGNLPLEISGGTLIKALFRNEKAGYGLLGYDDMVGMR